jgi:gliding motility-associated-like protein
MMNSQFFEAKFGFQHKKSIFNLFKIIEMNTVTRFCIWLVGFFLMAIPVRAQIPNCAGADSNLLFVHQGAGVMAYNPALPLSGTNPYLYLAAGGVAMAGLTVSNNLNGGTPSPAFYTTAGGNFQYYNGTTWVNTGHTASAVNPGGGIANIYNKNGGTGQIFRYNGTGPATLLTTVAPGSGPYDVVTDNQDNFYHLYTSVSPGYIIKYSPLGVPLDTIDVIGNPIQTAGGGFAMIGNRVFAVFNTSPSFYSGVVVGGSVTLTPIGQMSASDLATCPQVVQPISTNPVPPPEAAFIMSDDTICSGTCITLTDQSTGAPTSWTWTINGGTPSTSVAPNPGTVCFNTAGTFVIRLIAANNGGADTATKTIVVYQTPTASISGDSVLCAGENTVLSASPVGNYNYAWSNNANSSSINIAPTSSGTYSVVVSQNGCADTASIFVQVDVLGQAIITGDTVLCIGESTTLTVSPNAAGISWNTGSGNASIAVTPNATTTYSVILTQGVCTSTATATVGVYPYPIVSLVPTLTDCDIENGTLAAQVSSGTPAYSYSWNNGQSGAVATGLGVGNYAVVVTDTKGCSATANGVVGIHPNPTLVVTPSSANIRMGDTLPITTTGGVLYYWVPPYGLSCSTCPDPLAFPYQSTLYCVEGYDEHGCKDTACVQINVEPTCNEYFVPNAFSPNGDGVNDRFLVKGRCVTHAFIKVMNRWGEMVFNSQVSGDSWDGTFKGAKQNPGVFFYLIDLQLLDGRRLTLSGDLTLLR